MDLNNQLVFVISLLFLASILATVITPRLGIPILLIFLCIGMLAGENGPGHIHFANYPLANFIGTVGLAVVLFDGGLRTSLQSFRVGLRPALMLSTVGVALTALVVGGFSAWLLGLSPPEGLLIGAIVASTDAAAVFSLLHTRELFLNERVTSVLEIESGSNDPMAVCLTLGLVHYLQAPETFGALQAAQFLVLQLGVGAALGYGGGLLAVRAINRLQLADSLYPLLALFAGLLIFGLTGLLGGSGFLAVYLAGIVIGNRRLRAAASIRRFHDGIAWMSQIGMFLILGLLVTPRALLPVATPGLLIAAVLILVARPLAVIASFLPFRIPFAEQAFVGWVGLRGSVPIVLATFPWLANLEHAAVFFNIVFFIVLVSLVVQGWSVAPAARLLRLELPPSSALVDRVDFDLPGQSGWEIVSYKLAPETAAVGLRTKELGLPDPARVVCVARRGRLLNYRDWGALQAGDTVSLLASQEELPVLDRVFQSRSDRGADARHPFFGEFSLSPDAPASLLAETYGLELPPFARGLSLADFIRRVLPRPVVGDKLRLGEVELVVRRLERGKPVEIGLRLPH